MAYPQAICEILRSYTSANKDAPHSLAEQCTIWEAARATSAAPLYFPEMHINGQEYWDGGMKSNNPILEVFTEARKEFGEDANFKLILSIGTGQPERKEAWPGALGIFQIALQFLTDTEAKHQEFIDRFGNKYAGDDKPYLRLNGDHRLGQIDLADYRNLGVVEELAKAYIKSPDGSRYIEECARRLAKGR